MSERGAAGELRRRGLITAPTRGLPAPAQPPHPSPAPGSSRSTTRRDVAPAAVVLIAAVLLFTQTAFGQLPERVLAWREYLAERSPSSGRSSATGRGGGLSEREPGERGGDGGTGGGAS